MRPAGEVHLALLRAAHSLRAERAASGQGATLLELAQRACVGYKVARIMVPSLKRHGHLRVVGDCRVPGRNRPALTYGPSAVEEPASPRFKGAELAASVAAWAVEPVLEGEQ